MAPEERAQLDAHLAALLALGPPRAAIAQDPNLVASVREMLSAYPLEYRVYSRVKRQYKPGSANDFSVAAAAGPNAAQVFQRTSAEPLSKGISGLYTKDAYRRLVLPAIKEATPRLAQEEGWVLGLRVDPARLRDATLGDAVTDKVRRLYFEDYIKTWDAYLADVKLVKLNDPERALAVSRILSAVDSPLAAYLRGITEQTRLVQAAAAPNALEKAANQAKADAARLAGAAPAAGGAGGPLERIVDDHFAGIHRLVTGDPPPINDTLKLFGELFAQLAAVDAAKKSKTPPPPAGGAERVKVAAAGQPDLVRGLVEQTLAEFGLSGVIE
jgi:type VI secretion system protein ImpL